MKKIAFLFLTIFFSFFVSAQTLLPSIGIGSIPSDSDPICSIPWYLGSFNNSGYQEGDTAHDFTLYDTLGNILNLAAALTAGKPVLLISSSYTCPVFRSMIPSINNVVTSYGSQVNTYIIYTVEAHPTDTSPYFGYINITSQNQSAGILYPQPTNYGQRKFMVHELTDTINILAPIFIDGPCNNFWLNYGPAPNNAYLIDTNGIIFAKHAWYDRYPGNIICDIDSLLGNIVTCNASANGHFILKPITNDTTFGIVGDVLTLSSDLINTSTTEDVIIGIKRISNTLAPGWQSALCAGACYPASTDSITVLISPGDTLNFHFYFLTDTIANSSWAKIGYRNVNDLSNGFSQNFTGITSLDTVTTGIHTYSSNDLISALTVFPNPAKNEINLVIGKLSASADYLFEISDISGKKIKDFVMNTKSSRVDVSFLLNGYYFLKAEVNGKQFVVPLVIAR